METTHIGKGLLAVIVLGVAIFAVVVFSPGHGTGGQAIDPTPQDATLSGTYGCLPHANPNGPQTEECAFGIKTDDGVEVLVHVGIDTVQLEGKGFTVECRKDERVEAGDLLAKVDLDVIKAAGYDTTTIVVVINTLALKAVTPRPPSVVASGDPVIDVTP